MSHPWKADVLGGVGAPRILEIDSNWITDVYFQEGLGNWSQSTPNILTRIKMSSAYVEFMGNISYVSDQEYIYRTYNYGSSIADKTFIFTLRIQSDYQYKISFYGSSEFGATVFSASTSTSRKTLIITATGQTGNNIQIRIHGSTITGSAMLYFDDAYFTEVLADYTFSQPQDSFMKFENRFIANELWTGAKQCIGDKRLPVFYAKWDYFDDTYESNRQLISEAERLFCVPHNDASFGFLGVWNKEFFRGYALDRFFGHDAIITITGEKYLLEQPAEIVEGNVWYIEDDIIWDL
jgi:hypothetical protein